MTARYKSVSGVLCKALIGLSLGSLLFTARASGAEWHAERIPQYDRLFQNTNGWIGADGDFTVLLKNGLTLWLFSDTFIGTVRHGRRVQATMINNSAAWQHGLNPPHSKVEFFYRKSADGTPASLVTPPEKRGWFWLFDGVMARGKLFLFLLQIDRTNETSGFGFRQIGTWLGEVSNPLAPPTQWHIVQKRIPFARSGAGGSRLFGSAILARNGFIYVYGTDERKGSGREMILARAPEGKPGDFSTWRFRTRDGWSPKVEKAEPLCGGIATEYSVSWLPSLRRYVLISTENGLSEKIIARTAPEPWGPWSAASVVYRCPEARQDRKKQIFCYSAKAHPMLTTAPDELILTYAANSSDFTQVVNDARLYWPRFVRAKRN